MNDFKTSNLKRLKINKLILNHTNISCQLQKCPDTTVTTRVRDPAHVARLLMLEERYRTHRVYLWIHDRYQEIDFWSVVGLIFSFVFYATVVVCGFIISASDNPVIISLGIVSVIVTISNLYTVLIKVLQHILHKHQFFALGYMPRCHKDPTIINKKDQVGCNRRFGLLGKRVCQAFKTCVQSNLTLTSVLGITLILYSTQRFRPYSTPSVETTTEYITDVAYYMLVGLFIVHLFVCFVSTFVSMFVAYVNMKTDTYSTTLLNHVFLS